MTERPILVVESERDLGQAIVEQLAADSYRVELARTAQHARILAGASAPSLAVLGGVDLPRGAVQLLEEIRAGGAGEAAWDKTLPVIVLGSGARALEVLRAFDAGADDYLASSAGYLELRARMRAILRRTESVARHGALLQVGPLAIDTHAHMVSVEGRTVGLRRMEFELLLHLASDPGRVFTKDEILRAVWGYRASGSTRTLDSHASRLRRKLDTHDGRRWVVNVWGVGYRLS